MVFLRDCALIGVLIGLGARLVFGQTMPDPALTPGVVALTDVHEVCAYAGGLSYSKRHRVWTNKAGTLRKYSLPLRDGRLYEDDDRIPVCVGGDNADPRNHWPQPWPEARIKDHLEWRVCRDVCAGRMTLQDGQAIFLGDWRARLQN